MDFTEREILIAEQLKAAGVQWRPRQGDYYAEKDLSVVFVNKELADRLVHEDYSLMDKVWLPQWHQCRDVVDKLGFLLRDHCEDIVVEDDERKRFVGVAVESVHRGAYAAEGGTDLEAFYEVIFKLITSSAGEQKSSTKSGRMQGKVCQRCLSFMKLKEVAGAWQYVCDSCSGGQLSGGQLSGGQISGGHGPVS